MRPDGRSAARGRALARSLVVALPLIVALLPLRAAGEAPRASTGTPPPSECADILGSAGVGVIPGRVPDMISAYDAVEDDGWPAFVTSDFALLSTWDLLEEVLLGVEDRHLYHRLADLSRALVRLSGEQYLGAADPEAKEAARLNEAFFAVGLSLLDPDYFPSESVRGLVERELALIEEGTDVTLSPIMGATPLDGVVGPGEDYREYAPRGRAALDDRLGRLHMAITWYSRMAFGLPEGRVLDYGPTMQALLVALAMQAEGGDWLDAWEEIYDPLLFYLGGSGDPTIVDYISAAQEVFGEAFGADDVSDEARLAAFVEIVGKDAPPHFETHELRGLRLLARPTLADTKYFARLSGSADRPLPAALDIAGLLGSRWARSTLEERDAFASDLYRRGFDDITNDLETRDYAEWTKDVPSSWLYALDALASAPPAGSPPFASSASWAAKEVSTIAAGWSLLRRDPVGLSAAAGPPPEPRTPVPPYLVEPCPLAFGRLRELTEHVRDRLWENHLLDDDVAAALSAHRDFLLSLERASDRGQGRVAGDAAAGAVPDPTAHVRALAARLGAPPPAVSVLPVDAFAARAYTDLVSDRALAVAIGRPDIIYALVLDDPDGPVYTGAVLSYYEWETPGETRTTSGEWKRRIGRPPPLDRPWWVPDYLRGP